MLFKDMTPEDLREAYKAERTVLHSISQMSNHLRPKGSNGKAQARHFAAAMRNVEMIERIADKKGISLRG